MPALVPNRLARAIQAADNDFPYWPFIDTLYDYTAILKPSSDIAVLPAGKAGTSVAVVGAGAAGMCAGYELLRMGLSPTIFEASNRVGGRTWSEPFDPTNSQDTTFAEMGAMRVPPSSRVFWSYADQFGIEGTWFPDPGMVLTTLYYENQRLTWEPNKENPSKRLPPPGVFAEIQRAWDKFIEPFLKDINDAWQQGEHDPARLVPVWQRYIDGYANLSFYEALVDRESPLGGIKDWGPKELNAFGALGLGSGGFGPLYDVGFLEMLRLIVNGLEVDQKGIKGGVRMLTEGPLHDPGGFLNTQVTQPSGQRTSLAASNAVRLGCTVTDIGSRPGSQPQLTYTNANGQPVTETFAAIIVATTTRAMELMGLTLPAPSGEAALAEPVRVALRNVHMMSSSKLFIRTKTKFWKDDPTIPANIQTDELPRGVYTLDYHDTDEGIVLVSYTWGDDSDKLLPLGPEARLAAFTRAISAASPEFASYLKPTSDQILMVDWQDEPDYYGAFKLNLPGQEPDLQAAYYQFQTAGTPDDTGVYLAGDGVSWTGGWTEGALQTALNAVCAVAHRLGAGFPNGSPLEQNPNLYAYFPARKPEHAAVQS